MYTPFEGTEFFTSYRKERRRCRQILAASLTSFNLMSFSAQTICRRGIQDLGDFALTELPIREGSRAEGIRSAVLPKSIPQPQQDRPLPDPGSKVHVEELLASLLDRVRASSTLMTDEARAWLDRLASRYEVTKRIYAEYEPGFRKGAGCFDHVDAYAVTAFLFGAFCMSDMNLKYVNVLLKLNDLTCSVIGTDSFNASPAGHAAAYFALIYEHRHTANLMKEQNLDGID